MEEQKTITESENKTPAPAAQESAAQDKKGSTRRPVRGSNRRRDGNRRGGRQERKPSEFKEKVVDLRRVTRVMGGGKRFRFRATLIIGDEKGRVGVGMGKAADVVGAIGKAKNDAKKNLITIVRDKGTIPHEVMAKFSAARVVLKPAKEGNGLVAGGATRVVLSMAGIKDVTAKCLSKTSNKVTNAMATIEALKKLKGKDKKVRTIKAAPKKETVEVA